MTESNEKTSPTPGQAAAKQASTDPVPDSDKDKAASVAAAAVSPAPTPSIPASASAGDTKRLRVAEPLWVQAFHFGGDDDTSKIDVTRDGSDVPADKADSVIEEASKHGVTIKEVSK